GIPAHGHLDLCRGRSTAATGHRSYRRTHLCNCPHSDRSTCSICCLRTEVFAKGQGSQKRAGHITSDDPSPLELWAGLYYYRGTGRGDSFEEQQRPESILSTGRAKWGLDWQWN